MKALAFAILGGLLLTATACDREREDRTAVTTAGRGFELNDVSDQSIQQTDSNSVLVTIDRKGGFEGPITIEVFGLPSGVTVDGGARHTIKENDNSISLKLMASDGAKAIDANAVTVKASATVDGQQISKQDVFNLEVKSKG